MSVAVSDLVDDYCAVAIVAVEVDYDCVDDEVEDLLAVGEWIVRKTRYMPPEQRSRLVVAESSLLEYLGRPSGEEASRPRRPTLWERLLAAG